MTNTLYELGAWLLFFICLFYYCSIFPLISQGIEFFSGWWTRCYEHTETFADGSTNVTVTCYEVEEEQARVLTSAPYVISMFLVPFIGIAVDVTKHNVYRSFGEK